MRLAVAVHGVAAACYYLHASREAVELVVDELLPGAPQPDCVSALPNRYQEAAEPPDAQG